MSPTDGDLIPITIFNCQTTIIIIIIIFFSWRDSPLVGLGFLIIHVDFCGFEITHDTPQLIGLLWTSDQLAAETST